MKGFKQEHGVDYDKIFSPVVKMTTLRLLLGVMLTKDLELEQLDVKTTFLHRDLDEGIYMSQPTGFPAMGGGILPRMLTEEKPLWIKTSAKDMVPEVRLLHPTACLPPV